MDSMGRSIGYFIQKKTRTLCEKGIRKGTIVIMIDVFYTIIFNNKFRFLDDIRETFLNDINIFFS
jgi:hypothetical protein